MLRQINKSKNISTFLLYVSVVLIVTFLQQEFVLLPELQGLDIIEDGAKSELIDRYQKWRWLSFVISPLLLIIRLSLVSLCLFIGGFFYSETGGNKFKDWWVVALRAQAVLLVYSVILCYANILIGANQAMTVSKFTSLLFLGSDSMQEWVRMPLAAVNIFEIAYWIVMSVLVSKLVGTKFGRSFKFVMSSYGVGYLCYIVLLMFLMLYIG